MASLSGAQHCRVARPSLSHHSWLKAAACTSLWADMKGPHFCPHGLLGRAEPSTLWAAACCEDTSGACGMQVQVLGNARLSIPTSPEVWAQQGTQPHEDAVPQQCFNSGGLLRAWIPRDAPEVSLDQTGQRFPCTSHTDVISRAKPCFCQQQWRERAPQPHQCSCQGQAGCGRGEPSVEMAFLGGGCQQQEVSLMHLPLCPCPDDELPLEGGERTTSPPCQLGKPHPGDARMCCIPLPRQLTSYAAEAGVCGVMPHESRTASDLSVTGTGRDQRGTVRAELLG